MKLSLDDKLEIISLIESGWSYKKIQLKFKICESTLKRIIRQYRKHGIKSFKPKGKNMKYSPEFKCEIVMRVLSGESKGGIASELCVNVGMIHSWVKKYLELGYNGLTIKTGRPRKMNSKKEQTLKFNNTEKLDDKDRRIKELEERNSQLEMENYLLKKLKALVQQRTQQQKKKK